MPRRFEEDVFYGLPRPQLALNDILHDEDTSQKRFTRSITFSLTPEMHQAAQEIVGHRNLPFQGNLSTFLRHALGSTLEGLDGFLDDNSRTIFRALMTQQRRLTRERFIVTIEDNIEQQVDILRFWTAKSKWGEVVRTMTGFLSEVEEYPVAVWREHAAGMWLRNAGLKDLLKVWEATMKDDDAHRWQEVEQVYKRFERASGA